MTATKQPICHDCGKICETWVELAHHVVLQKKTHKRQSRVWALRFLSKVQDKKSFKPRTPLSEEQKQTLKDNVRELSGEMEVAICRCSNCNKKYKAQVEVEYLADADIWKDADGNVMRNCQECSDKIRGGRK